MIASVSGVVQVVGLTSAVIEVGGVGLELQCSPATLAGLRTGEHASLASSLVVREESLTLFGFSGRDEKAVFELVQTASGVGPKLAQAMLAVLGPDEVRRAIAGEDHKTLTRVPGIGAKGAQRIVLELKDKMSAPVATQPGQPAPAVQAPWRAQVVEALTGLGWSTKESEKAADAVAPEPGAPAEVAVLLRAALQSLSRA